MEGQAGRLSNMRKMILIKGILKEQCVNVCVFLCEYKWLKMGSSNEQ